MAELNTLALTLISVTTPVNGSSSVEILLPAEYTWFEVRWGALGYTSASATSLRGQMKSAAFTYDENDPSPASLGDEEYGYMIIAPLTSGAWITKTIIGNTGQAHSGDRPTHLKLNPNTDTFNGTGKIWLQGIIS